MQADQPSDVSVKSSGPWLEGGSYGHLLTPPLPPIHIPAVLLALLTLLGNHAAAKTVSTSNICLCPEDLYLLSAPLGGLSWWGLHLLEMS